MIYLNKSLWNLTVKTLRMLMSTGVLVQNKFLKDKKSLFRADETKIANCVPAAATSQHIQASIKRNQ